MEIRKVQTKDIPRIKTIADSLVVTLKDIDKKTGFYDYPLSEEQYTLRSKSDLFLVGFRNSQLEGFCMAYDSDFIGRLLEQEPQLKREVVFDYLKQLPESYVYLDQLAVKNPGTFFGSVCACRLFERLKETSKGKQFIQGVIPHSPWKNESSIRFFTHQGGKLIKEIGDKNKIVFGVYQLNLV